ncbi:MAG: class I SAM-dependent methyltransferase [Pseudomonadota bacterium]
MRQKLQTAFSGIDWSERKKGIPRSGPGSTLAHTETLRQALPDLFRAYNVTSFVDAPCGDWHWMQHVDLTGVSYLGLDIVEDIVTANANSFATDTVRFGLADITNDPLPAADMIMCRDCLFHLRFWLRWAFFENFLASGTPYLLTTVHDNPVNRNVPENGKFRWFNPRIAPFNLSEPIHLIPDTPAAQQAAASDDFRTRRYMGLWHRDQIAAGLAARDAA